MAKRDYYDILEISRDVSEDAIKKAYRKLAVKYHPDKNPGDKEAEEKFKEATEAYEVLKDSQRRTQYDQFGHAGVSGQGGFQDFSGGFGGFDLSDALRAFMRDFGGFGGFEDFFGGQTGRGGGRRRTHQQGEDLQLKLSLTLEEIASGVEKKIKLKRFIKCEGCGGSGAEKGAGYKTCPQCNGSGELRRVSRTFLGQVVNVTACNMCSGEGRIIANPCKACDGDGRIRGESTINVKVPAGVSAGNYIPIRGSGNVGRRGGPAGDAIVIIDEKNHPVFERRGDDLVSEIAINYPLAAMGGEIEVPILNGKVKLKIPPGTQSGKVFRLRGKGLPRLQGYSHGDQLIVAIVWVPDKLSNEEKELLKQLAKIQGDKPSKTDKSFFDKLRQTIGV
ncbi:MAG: molecular chaperone DnaJ [candidate division Zixibacteria bacterium]|nr:molecular chaperone DnaJ [candidate division Zixibacteria bacterium]